MIDDELRLAQAQLRLGRINAARLVALARDALSAGRDTPALCELAMVDPYAPVADAAMLFTRALDELGLEPIAEAEALERTLWSAARRIARDIVDGKRPPLDGARALDDLFEDFGGPAELSEFCYAVSMSDPQVATETSLPKLEHLVVEAARKLLQR